MPSAFRPEFSLSQRHNESEDVAVEDNRRWSSSEGWDPKTYVLAADRARR